MGEILSKNMTLIDHNDLAGFGGVGEGMALQVAPDGRRILWIAHEGPPKTFPVLTSQTREIAKLFVKQNYPITICAPILWRSLVTLWRSPIKSMNWGC